MQRRWAWLLAVVVLMVPGVVGAQTEWVGDPANPVIGPADPADWDGGNRNPLAVIKVDGIYHLYFNGQEAGSPFLESYDIGHATSTDGVSWEMDPVNPVLTRGAEGEWDDLSLWGAAVIHDQSGFRMWYSGCDDEDCPAGYATSTDGSAWTKYAGNPIINVGPPGSFDDNGVLPNAVIIVDGIYRMWYTSDRAVGGPDDYDWRIGYAESDDGLSWTKHSEPVLEGDEGWDGWVAFGASVLYDGSTYHMWYEGAVPGVPAIGYAVSPDGIEWSRFWGNPVLASSRQEPEFPTVLFNGDTGVHEMWFGNFRDSGIGRATSDCCSTIFPSIIPAAAYASGAEGSFYETDVDLSNAGSTSAEYRFFWLPRGENNGEPMESELFNLGAGMSVRYSNVLAEVFDLEPGAFGALTIEASSLDLLAMARIANISQDGGGGTFGQAISAVLLDDFTGLGQRRRILFGTEGADMRTNVGCFNASDMATRVNFELFAADGSLLGTEDLILMPWSNDQINRIFDPYHPVTGCVDFWTDVAGTDVYCYGSVLDNVTSDPTTIPPM